MDSETEPNDEEGCQRFFRKRLRRDENRLYPWGVDEPDATLAVYDCLGDGSMAGDCAPGDILSVGSKPLGNGRWGHSDLAGSMCEWILDPPGADHPSITRGGGFLLSRASKLRPAAHTSEFPSFRYLDLGLRCARDP